jgi:hypothetical protein
MKNEERKIRKAVLKAGGTMFDLKVAVILCRLQSFEAAEEYVNGIKKS